MDSLLNGWGDNLAISVFGKDALRWELLLANHKISVEYIDREFPNNSFSQIAEYLVDKHGYEYVEMLEQEGNMSRLFKGLIKIINEWD